MEQIVTVRGLSKSFGGLTAVENLNFEINRGSVFGLLGANGAGKSTAVECILGTKKADTGEVTILGMNPQKQRKQLFEMVGVQFQEANYQEGITVRELCEETAAFYKKPADFKELLKRFGIYETQKSLVKELSGGQRQKLFIVLALISNPQFVVLDELTTGLDTKARREVWKILSELKEKGLTILLISHFMDEVEALCDRVCILKKGRTVFGGTVKEAVENSKCESFEDAYLFYSDEEAAEYENV